jgi:hypothetical protein
MLTMVFLLAITSTALELMIASKIPAWRRLSAKSPLFNLLNSLLLSYLMGIAFGAAGLIAMSAGVVSTLLSIPGYQFLAWNYDSPKAQSLGTTRTTHAKQSVQSKYHKSKEVINDLGTIAYGTGKVITAPIWIPRRINTKLKARKVA